MAAELSFKELTRQLFQKRWIRLLALIPTILFSLVAVFIFGTIISGLFFRAPNHAPVVSFDGPALIIWFLVSGFSVIVGICAVITAYLMRGVFRILYFSGAVFCVGAVGCFPIAVLITPPVDFALRLEDPQVLVGKWMDDSHQLKLSADSTFVLTGNSMDWMSFPAEKMGGTWSLDGNIIYFSHSDRNTVKECLVTESEGFYFITYEEIVDLDAFSGDLGLMREKDWLANQ